MKKFLPIILGSDLNTYSIAREIHEAYGIKSAVATSMVLLPCLNSKIIEVYTRENFSKDEEIFRSLLNDIYHQNKAEYEEFIIFAPDDNFRNMTIRNLENLDFKPHMPYPNLDFINGLLTKNDFYQKVSELDLVPQTILAGPDDFMDLAYPANVYIKADNDIDYKKKVFDGWQKGYHSHSVDETKKILAKIYDNGYQDKMIVQEFVAGGDGTEYSVDGYRSADVISMAACKNTMLDKRPDWIGNFVAKVDTDDEIVFDLARAIVETLDVQGLFNIDFKKDIETNKFYAFEINLRQGRCHYYATQNGVNLSQIAIEDKVFGKQSELKGDKPFAYYNLDLDKTLANMPEDLKEEFTTDARMENLANPLIYEKDNGIMRRTKIKKYLEKLSAETFIYKEI